MKRKGIAKRLVCASLGLLLAAGVLLSCSDGGGSSSSSTSSSSSYGSVTLYPINADIDDDFMYGFDASMVSHLEDCGAAFYETDGTKTDIFKILASHGFNWVRFRIWHTPASSLPGNNTYARTLAMAKRAKAAGLKVLLDFHYSDTWADPSKQYYPASWDDISAIGSTSDKTESTSSLCGTVYAYTYEVVNNLKSAGYAPDMVQIGNEINGGMLTKQSDGSSTPTVSCSTSNSTNLNYVLQSAANAVKAVDSDIDVMIHLASSSFSSSWFSSYASGVDYDYIGLSYYPFYSSHSTLETLRGRIETLKSTYNKEVLVVETSWGWSFDEWSDNTSNEFWYDDGVTAASLLVDDDSTLLGFLETQKYSGSTCISASYQNQATIARAIVEAVANAGGCGVFYWGGDWIPDGNNQIADNWENQTLFDFDGVALPSIDMFAEATTTTTGSTSTTAVTDWTSVSSGTYSGYYQGDISDFSLSSSSPSKLISSDTASSASEIVIVFTTNSTNYATAWLSLCSDTSWSNVIESGVYGQSSASTYTLTLGSSGVYRDSSTQLYFKSASGTPTLSSYSSTGIYVAALYCTISAVYYK